ncbi:MAG: hypothetical protein J6T98_12965 [Salinivirgaceae bacterium]|jgi:hypothetical protein|nr:hypothetical protein [Salinivirgaceae bacterium]
MGTTIDTVWAKAQRLSPSERLALSRRLAESVTETEKARRERVTKEMDQFFGGWANDERTTDEIMAQIRAGRTKNTFPNI